jgi:hypothetical protein
MSDIQQLEAAGWATDRWAKIITAQTVHSQTLSFWPLPTIATTALQPMRARLL